MVEYILSKISISTKFRFSLKIWFRPKLPFLSHLTKKVHNLGNLFAIVCYICVSDTENVRLFVRRNTFERACIGFGPTEIPESVSYSDKL